ncbi:MAG: glutamyl-tRNA reductase [bacterium]
MQIILVGSSHKISEITTREKLYFSEKALPHALQELLTYNGLTEAGILSTCNRVEIYAVSTDPEQARANIISFLSHYHHLPADEIGPKLYTYFDQEAITHLFKVAPGLDSMVAGEPQILGQVKKAYQIACEARTIGPYLDHLFQRTFSAAKRIRTETGIGKGAISISFAAVELAKKIFGDLSSKTVLIIGAGKMGEDTVRHLISNGVKAVLFANRTYEKACELAAKFNGVARPFDDLPSLLLQADIVITSTNASHQIIHYNGVKAVMPKRRFKSLFFIDIAVPRDIEEAVGEIDNVYLYNIDDLEGVVQSNLLYRAQEIARSEAIIEEEVAEFLTWLRLKDVSPLISALKEKVEEMRQEELSRVLNKTMTEQERQRLDNLSRRLSHRFLKAPILGLKEKARQGLDPVLSKSLLDLFGVSKETTKNTNEHE